MQAPTIRSYARKVIETYNLTHPLNIQRAVLMLGFQVKYVDTGRCDAYTIIAKGKKLILLNKNITNARRINFTLAHELGHYFIPSHLDPLYACNVNETVSSLTLTHPNVERQADIFASELLLPSNLMEKNSNIASMKDIVDVADKFNTSIPATAIRMMEHSYDIVCFICCKKDIIDWFYPSRGFSEYFMLSEFKGNPVPEYSLYITCLKNNLSNLNGKVPACMWIDNVASDLFIEEEVLFFPKYNIGYILLKADMLISYDN